MAIQATELQLRALAYVPKPPAALSFVASLYILCSVLTSRERRSKVYHRICAAMALNGCIYSAAFFWGAWAMPAQGDVGAAVPPLLEAEEERIGVTLGYHDGGGNASSVAAAAAATTAAETGAMATQQYHDAGAGTWGTCAAQGFLLQYGFAVPSYYASLSIYALLAVRHNFDRMKLSKVEPYIHVICTGFPLATAILLLMKDMYNPIGSWCWIGTYPPGCTDSPPEGGSDDVVPCIRGHGFSVYMWVFGFGLMFFFLGFSTMMMVMLYWTVQRRERASKIFVGKTEILEKARRARSRMILHQAGQYLAAFYATYVLSITSRLVQYFSGSLNLNLHIVSITVVPLQGFLYFIVYTRLRVSRRNKEGDKVSIAPLTLRMSRMSLTKRLSWTRAISDGIMSWPSEKRWGLSSFIVRGGGGQEPRLEGDENRGGEVEIQSPSWRCSGSAAKREFSIFDGTNCREGSIWAEFLGDDVEELEVEDDGEERPDVEDLEKPSDLGKCEESGGGTSLVLAPDEKDVSDRGQTVAGNPEVLNTERV